MNLQKCIVTLGTVAALAILADPARAGIADLMFRGLDDGTATDLPAPDFGTFGITVRSCGGECVTADVSGMTMNAGIDPFSVESATETFVAASAPSIAADLGTRDLNQIVPPPVATITSASLAGTVLRTSPDLGYTNNFPTTSSSSSNAMTETVVLLGTDTLSNTNVGIQAVPEPEGILLMAIGALALGLVRRRR